MPRATQATRTPIIAYSTGPRIPPSTASTSHEKESRADGSASQRVGDEKPAAERLGYQSAAITSTGATEPISARTSRAGFAPRRLGGGATPAPRRTRARGSDR